MWVPIIRSWALTSALTYQLAAMYWVSHNSYSGHLTDVPLSTTEYHNAPKPQVNSNDCPQTVNGCCDHGDPWGTVSY